MLVKEALKEQNQHDASDIRKVHQQGLDSVFLQYRDLLALQRAEKTRQQMRK